MELLFSNGQECKSKIIESISDSKSKIRLAMAYFTDRDIANELIVASQRGVSIIVVLSDDLGNNIIDSSINKFCKVIIHEVDGRGLMHHKFCIIDDKLLIHGSYNYTYNALNNNEESLNITDSEYLINQYSIIFENLINKDNFSMENSNFEKSVDKESNSEYSEKFYNELRGHIQHILDFDKEKIIGEGKELSEQHNHSDVIFTNKLDDILSDVQSLVNQDDQKKEFIKVKMHSSLEKHKNLNSDFLASNLKLNESKSIDFKELTQNQINTKKERKFSKQAEIDKIQGQIDNSKLKISETQEEIYNLDRQITVEKFWTLPRYLGLLALFLLIPYLSIFFASAYWKFIFEESELQKLLNLGITPDQPPIIDANALSKLFIKKGIVHAFIGAIIFLIPLLLSVFKLILPNSSKFLVWTMKFLGLFIVDVIVSVLISQHTLDTKNILYGTTEVWFLSNAIATGDFWSIFIFGALFLFITSVIIEALWIAYQKSDISFVHHDRNAIRNQLRERKAMMESDIISIQSSFNKLKSELEEIIIEISKLEDKINEIFEEEISKKSQLKIEFEARNKNLTEIYNRFISNVDSGSFLLLDVISGRISAFKEGYFLPITSLYLPNIASDKIGKLELACENWIKQNFKK